MSERESNKLEFAIFCIENVAEALGILHTQGSAWIREDLLAVMKKKGVVT